MGELTNEYKVREITNNRYDNGNVRRYPTGPFVYPIIKKDDTNIGYVQVCSIEEGWEIDVIYGIVLEENYASHKVLEKCGFKLVYQGIGKYQEKERELRKYILEC